MDDDDTIAPGWSLVPADICIGTGEFLTNGDVGIIPDPDEDLKDVNYDRRKESFDVFREEFFQRLAEEYEYRADDKRRAWLALCDDEEAPLPDPPARKVAGYERMAAAIRGLAKETEEE